MCIFNTSIKQNIPREKNTEINGYRQTYLCSLPDEEVVLGDKQVSISSEFHKKL